MSPDPRLLVIVPALNERDALPDVVREIRATDPGADVLVIDDGSTDDTAAQVDADGQHNPADLPALVAALGEADVAMGARFAGVGSYEARGPR